jgi:hypothetical protein
MQRQRKEFLRLPFEMGMWRHSLKFSVGIGGIQLPQTTRYGVVVECRCDSAYCGAPATYYWAVAEYNPDW